MVMYVMENQVTVNNCLYQNQFVEMGQDVRWIQIVILENFVQIPILMACTSVSKKMSNVTMGILFLEMVVAMFVKYIYLYQNQFVEMGQDVRWIQIVILENFVQIPILMA